jgi:hypothetical protein
MEMTAAAGPTADNGDGTSPIFSIGPLPPATSDPLATGRVF